jgi:hypothetical protein
MSSKVYGGVKVSSVPTTIIQTLSPQVKPIAVQQLLEETTSREVLLRQVISRLEQRYNCSLEELEARLDRGEGQEHPDWEDSIEWRNAVESLERAQVLRNILEWLINLLKPSPAS